MLESQIGLSLKNTRHADAAIPGAIRCNAREADWAHAAQRSGLHPSVGGACAAYHGILRAIAGVPTIVVGLGYIQQMGAYKLGFIVLRVLTSVWCHHCLLAPMYRFICRGCPAARLIMVIVNQARMIVRLKTV
jgi:hypothetical protein